jgi:hypothetical protein
MRHVVGYDEGRPIWSDNEHAGPARLRGYSSRLVNLVGAEYVPAGTLVQGLAKANAAPTIPTNNQRRRSHQRLERKAVVRRELEGDPRPNRDRCEFLLPKVGAPCARMSGHSVAGNGKGHRSRAALDHDNAMRRSA